MTITRLNLISFGKFKNTVIELPRCGVIYGKNGAGKSTVAAFIRIMLFGPRPARGLGDRVRYIPWDGVCMEGELAFTHRGTDYVIHRIMGASSKGDRCRVINKSTGETVASKPAEIFGGEESLMESTAYIAQASTVFSDGGSLGGALRAAALGEKGDICGALKILEEKRRLISSPRSKNGGALDAALENLAKLKAERSRLENLRGRLPQLREYRNELSASYADARNALAENGGKNFQRELELSEENLRYMEEKRSLAAQERYFPLWAAATASVFAAASAALLVLRNEPFAAISALFAAALAIAGFAASKKRRRKSEAATAALEGQISAAEGRIEKLRREAERQKASREEAQKDLDAAARDLFAAEEEIRRLEEIDPRSLDGEISSLEEEASALRERLRLIRAAEDGINAAYKKLGESWLPELSAAVAERVRFLTGEEIEIMADDGLNIKIYRNGPKDTRLLSAGTEEQIYLALRICAAEKLFLTDAPPLILDDPFVQYDSEREENAVNMLLKLSKKYQIILFTCKNTAVFSNKEFKILTI